MTLRLIVFDVDGTLIDSQAAILAAMRSAFLAEGLEPPDRRTILSIVGLSLPLAVATLAQEHDAATVSRLEQGYRDAFVRLRAEGEGEETSPLFPGALDALRRLHGAEALLAVATGKARRGLEHVLDAYDLRGFFVATQTADDAPSKPHPGMIDNLIRATGAEPADVVMIGDTSFDMEMARSAGARALGVSWGYHDVPLLREAGAERVIDRFDEIDAALEALAR
jgi:phosphoglycolate phosphatase